MTAGFWALFRHSWRRTRTLLVGMAVVLFWFQVGLAAVASWLQSQSGFGQLANLAPAGFRHLMGASLTGVLSVSGVVALGYFHTAIEAALVVLVLSIAGELAEEVGSGFVDVWLAQPVYRVVVVGRTIVWLVLAPTAVLLAMAAGSAAGQRFVLPPQVPRVSAVFVASLALNLWALVLCWAGIGVAVASVSRRRGSVLGYVGVAALVCLLVDYVARAWSPLASLAWLSPFHYFSPVDLVMGSVLRIRDVAVLVATFVVGSVFATGAYLRRDL